jgi:DNA mismatch repair protein MutL
VADSGAGPIEPMADRTIHILPEQVASQIAAGEVVERPASAVKELVENALDAGARSINVAIERGGAGLIAVTDDGCGMSREDAILSLRRHATSKIRAADDLNAVRTFGFRGEALAAIASVSRMTLRSRRHGDEAGAELAVEGGEIESAAACAIAPGTAIDVRELFFNTPARLKFLKTVTTEQAAIAETIQRLALANPSIAFSLSADERKILTVTRAASALERTRQLLGSKLAAQMLPFEVSVQGMRAWGLCATSQESFASARMIFTFVNRRVVRDRMLARAIAVAYQTLIPRGRFPAVALFLELRPEEVDVNVHPMKTEVRFRRGGAVFETVYHALRDRLADQTNGSVGGGSVRASAVQTLDGATGGVEGDAFGGGVANAAIAADLGMRTDAAPPPAERRLRLVADSVAAARVEQRALGLGYGGPSSGRDTGDTLALSPATVGQAAASAAPAVLGRFEAPIPQYASLRIIGQLFAGYIALESDDGLLLVDQHAAHERVTFERLRKELREGGIKTQALLTPATLELNPARAAQAMSALSELQAIGFVIEPFGAATLMVKEAPAVFGTENGLKLLSDMIDGMGDSGFARRSDGAFEDVLKQLACHGSVRAGRSLRHDEIVALLAELDRTEFKTNCPHGRPVHIRFPRGQIERMFRR